MKRNLLKTLLFLMVMPISILGFSQVQTGSSSSNIGFRTGYNVPIFSNDYTKTLGYSQTIYYAEDIRTAGTITQLTWECTVNDLMYADDWEIYIGHTTKREFEFDGDWVPLSELTQVFNGEVSINMTPISAARGDYYEVTADITDYAYNGIGNLVIAVNEVTLGSNIIDDFYCSLDQDGTKRSMIGSTLNGYELIDPANPPVSSLCQRYDAMPRLILHGLTVDCIKPVVLTSTPSYTQAELNWLESSTDNWNVIISEEPLLDNSGQTTYNVSTESYVATNLKMGTEYHAYVQSDCGSSQSAWVEEVFTTYCGTQSTFPYEQNFDGDNFPASCWTVEYDNTTPLSGNEMSHVGDEFRSSPQSFRFSSASTDGSYEEYLISPKLDPTAAKVISFWYKKSAAGSEVFSVGTSPKTYYSLPSYTWNTDVTDANDTWQEYTMFIEPGVSHVAIQYKSQHEQYLYIDDISISDASFCPQATNINITNKLSSSADISWLPGGGEANWNLIISENPVTDFASATKIELSSNSYAVSGLSSDTEYYVYLQSECSDISKSEWLESSFSTTCATISAPFTEDFENAGEVPSCWQNLGSEQWLFSKNAGVPASDHTNGYGYYAYVDDRSPQSTDINLETQPIDISGLTNPALLFWVYSDNGSSSVNTRLNIDIWDGTWHNNVASYYGNTGGWQQVYVPLSGYLSAGTIKVRFSADESTSVFDDLAIDDISIDDVPDCPPPTSISYSVIQDDYVYFTWVAGGSESSWRVVLSETPLSNPSSASYTTRTVQNFSGSSLNAGTNYYVYVQPRCGAIGGIWKSSSFTTQSPIITNLNTSNITTNTVDLNWYAGASETSWDVVLSKTEVTNFATATIHTVTSKPYTASGLSSGSNYYVYVRANYTDVNSEWTQINFNTLCAVVEDYPLLQSFEEATAPPNCWTTYQAANNYASAIHSSDLSYDGSQCYRFATNNLSLVHQQLLISPELNTGRSRQLSFWYREYESYGSPVFTVGTSTTGNNQADFTWQSYTTGISTTWTEYSLSLASDVKYICINFNPSSAFGNMLCIDYLQIKEMYVAPPANLSVNSVAPTSASLSWNAGASETNWNIILSETEITDFESATVIPVTSTVYNATSLTSYADYYFYVQSSMGGNDVSEWSEVSFSTPCAAVSSVNEGFENWPPPANCWRYINANDGSINNILHGSYSPRTGTRELSFCSYFPDEAPYDQYAISPYLSLTGAQKVAFWYKRDGRYPSTELFAVGYSTSSSSISDFVWNSDVTCSSYNFAEYVTYIPENAKYVAIHYKSDNEKYLYVDDFTISAMAGCVPPVSLNVSDISAYSATVNWGNIGAASAWNVVVSEIELADPSLGVVEAFTSTSIVKENLIPGTTYYVYVQSDCSGSTSDWIETSFDTECGPIVCYPYYNGFETTVAPSLCWSVEYESIDPVAGNIATHSNSMQRTGSRSFAFCSYSEDYAYETWLISPEFDFLNETKELTFWYTRNSGGVETFAVGTSISGTDLSNDFVWSEEITTDTYGWFEYNAELDANVKYVAIDYRSDGANKLHIDDFKIGFVSPKNLVVNNITAERADFSWDGGNGNITWNYVISETPIADFSSVVINEVSSNSVQPSGLSENTPYYFYVQNSKEAINEGWEEIEFTTPCQPMAVFPFFEGFEGEFPPACWTFYYSNSSHVNNITQSTTERTGTYALRFDSDYSESGIQMITTPLLQVTADKQLSFWYRASTYSQWEYFKVGTSTTGKALGDFTWESAVVTLSSTYSEYITTVPAGTKYVAIQYYSQNRKYLYIDDFTISSAPLSGIVSITDDGTPQFGETLTADATATNNSGNLSYIWYRNGVEISGETDGTYELIADDIGETITVEISSDVESGTLVSDATSTIGLADGPSTPLAPTLESKTANSITLNTNSGYEYRMASGSWQSSAEFTGLTQVTEYSFTQRIAQTSTHLASTASTSASFTTDAEDLSGTVTISGITVFGEELTSNTTGITNNTGTLTFQWLRGTSEISGANSASYVLTVEDIGSAISLEVGSTVQYGSVASSATATVTKASQATPAAPTVDSKTTTSITLDVLAGGEYSIDNGSNWQSATLFSGLTQGTEYTFVQRLAETSTHYASATSNATAEYTYGNPLAGSVTISGTAKFDETLSADASGITNNTGTLSYQWLRDGSDISGATGTSYTLIVDDIGASISVKVTSSIQSGDVTSAETATVTKADAPATPLAPTVASKTTTSITLTAIAGGEYSINNGSSWQSSAVFSGLSQGVEYTFVQRIAETATHYGSATSPSYSEYTQAEDLAGTISITTDGTPQFGETITANVSGVTNNTGTLEYYWYRGSSIITGAFTNTYTLVEADIAQTITVEITSSIQGGSLSSSATSVVGKANNTTTPVTPVTASVEANSITLTAVAGYEYAIDGSWQSSVSFAGLTQLTEYEFTQRIAETSTHLASATSTAINVTTDAEDIAGTVTISGTTKFGETLTANATVSNNTGTLQYQWYREGAIEITGEIGDSYTLKLADIGKKLYVVVTSTAQNNSLESALTATVTKADQDAPDAPTEASVTYNTITLNTVSGCEYAVDGGSFQSSTEFAGLTQVTTYEFTQRLAETETHKASPVSSLASISTSVAPLAGTVAISGTAKFGETLTADVSGVTNNTGTLSYQWKRGESNISGATSNTYVIVEADIDASIRLEVESSVQTGSLVSSATATVTKADNTTVPTDPVLSSKTYNSITLAEVVGYEYSIDNGTNWQSSTAFTALDDETAYNFIQRIAETNTHFASANSTSLSVTTDVRPANALTGTVTISGLLKYGQELTASVADDNNTGTLQYQWNRNSSPITGETGTTYTLASDDIGTNISVEVTSTIEVGSISSAATAAIQKADQDAPGAPVLSDKTENSITLVEAGGYEYSMDNITWSTTGTFTGLTAYTAYDLYQRLAETTTHNASAASDALSVTTLANMLTGTAAVVTDGSPQFGETLTATLTGDNNTGELTYQWVRDGSDVDGANESSYILALEDIGVTLTVNIGSTIERGVISSSATSVIDKANQDAPIAPVVDVIEHNAITLQAVVGAEYKLGEGDWQNVVLFEGLTPNTQYSFKQRMSESDTHYASDESGATVVTTLKVPLEGTIAIVDDGTPQFGETLTADVSGITNNTGILSYQWKRGEDAIVEGINSSYTLVIDDIASEISLVVNSSEESGELTAIASAVVEKADAEYPVTPVLADKTTSSVTLAEVDGYEYSMDATTWQPEVLFEDLEASTAYDFYQRIAETDSTNESVVSQKLTVTTDTLPLAGTVTITTDGTPQFGEELTVVVADDNNTGTLSYQWKRGDSYIADATSDKYTLELEDIGELISVVVTSSIQLDSIVSDTTVVIEKADQLAPVTPELVSKTDSSVVLVASDGCEYAVDNSEWQVEALFNNLDAETAYEFTQRLTETDTHKASPASESLNVTTDAITPVGYDVTFHVVGQTKGMLAGIVFNGVEYTTDVAGELIIPEVLPGTYNYTVTAVGYTMVQDTLTVIESPVVEEVILQLDVAPVYSVTFNVESNNEVIAGAVVSMANYGTAITNDLGIAVFDSVVPALSVGYSVEADGFEQVSATLTVVGADVVEEVEMTPISIEAYDVTFVVSDGQYAIRDAWVNLAGYDSVATDMNGRAIIEDVLAGDMLYTVFAEGYEMSQASVTVVDVDITEEVILIPTSIDQSLSFSISIYPNPVVNHLNVEFDTYFTGQIQLLNTVGKLLMTEDVFDESHVIIDMQRLNQGMFILVVKQDGVVRYERIIKQ